MDDQFYEKIMEIIDKANQRQTNDIKGEIENIKKAVLEAESKRIDLEGKLLLAQDKIHKLEKNFIKNNIIIFGAILTEGNTILEKVIHFLNRTLNASLTPHDINDVYTIGKKEEKPIIVKFTSYLKKIEILNKCKSIKNYNKENNTKILITNELTEKEQEEQRILRSHMKEARNKNLLAYISKGKLTIGKETYTVDDLKNLDAGKVETKQGTGTEQHQTSSCFQKELENIQNKPEEPIEEPSLKSKQVKTSGSRTRSTSSPSATGRNRKLK
nr:unnamed protein product [Callosobruchus analis]